MKNPFFLNRTRNQQQFKELIYPHIKFLYNMALRYSGNTYDAEDMVQESLSIAFTNFHQLRDDTKCKSWLFTILRNVYLKELRASNRKQTFETDERENYISHLETAAASLNTAQMLAKKVEESQIQEIVKNLPEKYKTPILLFYMEDMSYQEISEYLQVPVGTVMSRLSRAKDMLKKVMLKTCTIDSSSEKVVELKSFQKKR